MTTPFRQDTRRRLTSRAIFWNRRLPDGARRDQMPPASGHATPPSTKPSPLDRAWAWIHRTFPERQIYIRSDGRVQFFTFGPSLQATLAGLTLIFLGWVAFATVNVIFKDRIIAAKDHRYQQMQTAYENRVADLQLSYDELNGALVQAEDRFKATADTLQAKQNAISGFLNRARQVEAMTGAHPAPMAQPAPQPAMAGLAAGHGAAPAENLDVEAPADIANDADGSSQLTVMPGPAQPQPRVAHPVKSSFLDNAWKKVAALVDAAFQPLRTARAPARDLPAIYSQHPALRALAQQTARVAAIGRDETVLMARTGDTLGQGLGALRGLVRRTGINPDQFERKMAAREGVGGPDIPLDRVRIEGITDPEFTRAYLSAAARLDQLNGLTVAVDHVPLTMPVGGSNIEWTSSFGARVDPFTGRYAFHPGVDLAGPSGSWVHATAPGRVVFAGYRGGYGNMVEIDHGFGLHTRYGHLISIAVQVGANVGKGGNVGRMGSTGRSTGPHVHYEVWYDNALKNPANFIEAGRHVL